MTDVFALDQAGQDAEAQHAAANLFNPEDVHPSFWTGAGKAIGLAVPRAFADVAHAGELAASVPVGLAEPFLGYKQGELTDKYFSSVDPTVKDAVDYWKPDPATTGTAGQVLGGLTEGLTQLAAGGGNPALMITTTGLNRAMDLSDAGVSPDVAAAGGTIEAAATAAGVKIPFLGKSLLSRMASGAAGNVAVGRAAQLAEQQLLEHTGNEQAASGFQPWDLTSVSLDALMGLAYGGIAHLQSPVRPIERDAALTTLNAKHYQEDTAPGAPADLASSIAHNDAIEGAIRSILAGDPVVPPATIMGAGFVPTPRAQRLGPLDSTVTRAAAREQLDHIVNVLAGAKARGLELGDDLSNLDNERAITLAAEAHPAGPAPLEVPHAEIAAADLAPPQKEQLTDVYAHATEAKPVLDQAARDISKEIGTPHAPLLAEIKGVGRSVEKTVTDYAGDASKLKDVARATIVADNLDQVQKAIGAVRAKFGEPTKLRYTLDPELETRDGYRDVNMNVTIKGRPVEVQVTVPEMVGAKKQVHPLYEERRQLQAKAEKSGNTTAEMDARIRELDDQMHAAYAAAWKDFLSRSKVASATSAPSEVARLSENGLPSGTSQARIEVPPSGDGTADTGIPSTSQKIGSIPNRGRFTGSPPTGEIIPKIGASEPGQIGKENKVADPDVTSAKQLAVDNPDFKVATGEIGPDGTPVTVSAAELLARSEAEIAAAEEQGKAYEAAIECALQRGVA